jgi:hypothetical protein
VRTGSDGQAVVQLLDGSGIRLARSTLVKLAQLRFEDSGERSVRVEVLRGRIEAEVHKAAHSSSFDASTRVAVASVRGTVFRLAAEPAGSARVETLEGLVRLGSATDPGAAGLNVPRGQGARMQSTGSLGPLRQLPDSPLVVGPLRGDLPASAELSWSAVPGASQYHVEVARDADFLLEASEQVATDSRLLLVPRPGPGKWFWRVTATSWDGFWGAPSKVYSFTVTP